jgi:hypothetical protein
MRIALVFAQDVTADRTIASFRSPAMIAGLRHEGMDPVAVRFVPAGEPWRDAGAAAGAPETCWEEAALPQLVRGLGPDVIHTFGNINRVAPVWTQGARSGAAILHYLAAEPSELAAAAGPRRVWSLAHLRTRAASRAVTGLVGSCRATIGRYIEAGFFPRARFSMLAPPPIELADAAPAEAVAATPALPTLGYWASSGGADALELLCEGIRLTGNQHLFRLFVASAFDPPDVRLPANVVHVGATEVGDFIRTIDALVVPCSDDRALPAALLALRARRVVIAPDDSCIGEALEYGRHGVLFRSGDAFRLATAINEVVQSRRDRPFDFHGVGEILARTAPAEVARIFARAYRRLVDVGPRAAGGAP